MLAIVSHNGNRLGSINVTENGDHSYVVTMRTVLENGDLNIKRKPLNGSKANNGMYLLREVLNLFTDEELNIGNQDYSVERQIGRDSSEA